MGGDKKEREAFPSRPPAPLPGAARWGRHLPERSRGRTCPGPAVPSGAGSCPHPPPRSQPRPPGAAGPGPRPPAGPSLATAGFSWPDPRDRRVCRGQRPAPGTPGGTTSFPAPHPKPRASTSRCGAFPAPASPPAAESRGWGGPLPWVAPTSSVGSSHPCYQVQPSSGAGALQSTKGCFPQQGESPSPPATQSLGDAAALARAGGDNWPWQVCACLAQLCCRKVKGCSADEDGVQKRAPSRLRHNTSIRPSLAGQKEMHPSLILPCCVTIAEPC